MTKDLDKAIKRTDLKWYQQLPERFVARLKQKGINASYYPEAISPDIKDYAPYITSTSSDKLLLIKLEAVGATRSYYGFVPLTDPRGYCVIKGELINSKNKVLWRYKAEVTQPAVKPWDVAPDYLQVINALNLAVDNARQDIVNSFFSG